MKKVLSILLSVMMVAGLFVALIPTATAAVSDTGVQPAITDNMLTTIYEEDFENSDYYEETSDPDTGDPVLTPKYSNADLVAALGWSGSVGSSTLTLVEDDNGNHSVLFNSVADWVLNMVDDARLAGGNFVIEYTQKMVDNTAGDGQGLGFRQGYKSTDAGWNYLLKERGQFDLHCHYDYSTAANATNVGNTQNDIASGTVTYTNSAGKEITRTGGSIMNQSLNFKLVIDANRGIYVYNDSTLVMATTIAAIGNWSSDAHTLPSLLQIRCISGVDVEVDNIKVSVYDGLPYTCMTKTGSDSFVVSAVSTNAYPTTDNIRFEYFELYNASTETLNVYDYAFTMNQTTAIYPNISASTIFTVAPGAGNSVTKGSYTYEFDNPDYEDGQIQPGETAIIFNPSDWWNGLNVGAGAEEFKTLCLIGKMGMTEDEVSQLKIFNGASAKADGSGALYAMNNSGVCTIGVTKMVDGEPQISASTYIAESTLVDSFVCDVKQSTYNFYGFGYYHSNGGVTAGAANNYNFWDANGNYIPGGQITSSNAAGTTPGFIPEANRRPFTVTYKADGETFKTELGRLATDYTLTTSVPTKAGYTFAGWADAEGNVVTSVAAADMMSDKTFTATWIKNNEVQWVGFQAAIAEGDRYDLRLVGSVLTLDDVKNIAFSISVNGTEEKLVYLKYVYKSITTDFGEATFEVPNDGYVVVLEINNCRVDADIVVKAVTIYEDSTTATGAAANVEYPY